ncbi:MAG TPA: amidase family protein [Solirubrobacteraceae bacterium]|nr:amidase family protein [Solirubrobacteraceae bacterium]
MSARDEMCGWTATRIAAAVRAHELSRSEVVEAHLERIEQVNPAVNAIVQLRGDEALAEARAADDAGVQRGPLDGVPVTIKEHYDVAGMVCSEGSAGLADRRSPVDCVAVERLRAAGAIVIGKTNQPDFAMRWNTISGLYGTTRNPRDLALSAGGSSGGDAAAVAGGLAPIGLGSDLGGSIRVPATFCGICGLRATSGRIPNTIALPPRDGTPVRDHMNSPGPLARDVSDLGLALSVLGGAHPSDPATPPVPGLGPGRHNHPVRVAKMVTETGATVTPEVEAQVDRAAEALRDAGYEVVDAAIPSAAEAPDLWGRIVGTELLQFAIPKFRDQMEETCLDHIESLLALFEISERVEPYIEAWVHRRRLARETADWMEEHPLVLTPVAGMAPPRLDFDHLLDQEAIAALFDAMRNVVWVPLLGLPAVALPSGVQIVARRFHEAEALAAADVVLRALGPVEIAAGVPVARSAAGLG